MWPHVANAVCAAQLGKEHLALRKSKLALKALIQAVHASQTARVERAAHRLIFEIHLRGKKETDLVRNALEGHMLSWLQLALPKNRTNALLHLVDVLKYRCTT